MHEWLLGAHYTYCKTLVENYFYYCLDSRKKIEPIKFFDMVEPKYVWKNIDIKYKPCLQAIVIKLLDDILCFDGWAEKIKDLENWLDLKVNIQKDNITTMNNNQLDI